MIDVRPAPVPGPLNLAAATLGAAAADAASAAMPALTFAGEAGERSWTYAELWERVRAVGRAMLAAGLEPGDRVLLRLPHSPEYALAFFGAIAAGIVPIPASPQLTAEEAAFLIADAQAHGIVAASDMRLPGAARIEIAAARLMSLDGPGPLPETMAEDPAYLIYTSGTTARPKGVLHAHRSVMGRAMMVHAWEGLGPGDVTLHAGTLNWSYTMGAGLIDPWLARAHAVLYDGPRDRQLWPRLIARYGVTVFAAVPTVYRQMLKYAPPVPGDLPSLRHGLCAGEPLPPAVAEEWQRRTGTPLYEALGMTEVSTYISSGPATPVRPGSPGRPQPGRRVAVLPEESGETPLAAGEVGVLAVHRSDPGLMLGYWRRPAEDAQVYRGEWFVSGDLAAIDSDGYVWFRGRSDDTITSFGYRLSPAEIEAALASHEGVADAGVAALPLGADKTLVLACIVVREGAALDEAQLRAHVERRLAAYKRPHEYRFVAELPRTRNGKLLRRALSERFAAGTADE